MKISTMLEKIDEKQLFVSPIFSVKEDGGVTREKFFVRSGNSSSELSVSEFDSYQKGRFNS